MGPIFSIRSYNIPPIFFLLFLEIEGLELICWVAYLSPYRHVVLAVTLKSIREFY